MSVFLQCYYNTYMYLYLLCYVVFCTCCEIVQNKLILVSLSVYNQNSCSAIGVEGGGGGGLEAKNSGKIREEFGPNLGKKWRKITENKRQKNSGKMWAKR